MFSTALAPFYRLFYLLEDNDLLTPDSNVDLFSLHQVYLPKVNARLCVFREAYSCHGLRSEHNLSPVQLWLRGMLENNDEEATDGMQEIMSEVWQ